MVQEEEEECVNNIKFIALIPAYNPDFTLEKVVSELRKEDITVVVVDDGSNINSKEFFNKIKDQCHLITHEVNKGKGVALKTGIKYIKENFEKYVVVTMDCDGQHKLEDAKRLLEFASKNLDSLVLGSRLFDKDVPLRSKFGNTITKHIYSMVSGVNVKDTQTGLRAFSNELADVLLKIPGERFEYEINVLLELAKQNIPIKELIIETIYINNNKSSNFKAIQDSYKIYKEILKYSLASICSFLIDILSFGLLCHLLVNNQYFVQLANVIARIISGTFNFTINRKYVFKNKSNVKKVALQYLLLALFILILNTTLLSVLVSLSINKIVAKLITELILFFFSYLVQHCIIFKKEDNV